MLTSTLSSTKLAGRGVRGELKKLQPSADYDHLVGHSNGGDIAMFCAKHHPELVSRVITLDNLRVPFVLNDKMKILSFRSTGPNFRTDPGVLPTPERTKAVTSINSSLK
jgi:pimeloyl-ACP methyl ester carboxylesterase